jgi:hypothetical protein
VEECEKIREKQIDSGFAPQPGETLKFRSIRNCCGLEEEFWKINQKTKLFWVRLPVQRKFKVLEH